MKFNTYIMEDALEAIIDYRGKTPQKSESGIPTLSAKSVKNNFIDYNNCYYISQEEYNRFMVRGFPKKGDILLTTEAPLGMVAKLDRDDIAIAQRLLTLRGKNNILDNDYLLYFLQSSTGQHLLKSHETGTTVTGIKQAVFRKLEISIPNIEDQRKIATILSALDSRIELNTAINENLESQAQAIFIDLFITNAKPEWKMGTISDLGNVVGGGTPSKKVEEYYTNDGIAWITPKDLSNDKSKFITHGETDITDLGLAKSNATLMPRGSVLFSSRAPIGYIAIADGQVSTNQGFKSIVPFDNVGTAYVYYFLKENLSAIENVASGSTFKEVSGGAMKNFPAVIPDDDTLAKFKQFCSPLLEQQRALEYENRYLASLRDALLPKLMNGEIDVSEIKI